MFGRRKNQPDQYPSPYEGSDWAALRDYLERRAPLLDAHADPMFRPREQLVTIERLDVSVGVAGEPSVARWVQLLGGGPTVILQANTSPRAADDRGLLERGWSVFEPRGGPVLLNATVALDAGGCPQIVEMALDALTAPPRGEDPVHLRVVDAACRPQEQRG